LSLFAFWIAKRPANSKMSFGYHRIELIAALVSGGASWVLSGFLIYEGIQRLVHPHPVNGPIVLIVATLGLFANLLMLRFLHPTQSKNLNVKGAYIHILGDLLASIGVLISGALITLTHYYPLDSIITFLISLLVIKSAWKLIKETSYLLMEGTPQGFDPHQIENDLLKLPSIEGVHDLHIWAITPRQVNLSVHLVSKNAQEALREAEELLHINYHIQHTTIQVEFNSEQECSHCPFQK
jgi:cobalt-zinc-cadmium efflux system protein